MNKALALAVAAALAGFSGIANASTTISFNNTECPSCTNQASITNQWSSYGLTVNNAYWYTDSRDTFDGMGLSIGYGGNTSSINFNQVSNGITIDYWTISGNSTTYEALDASNNVLGTFNVTASNGDALGTYTFSGPVKELVWIGNSGYGQVSTLTINPVPEPGEYALMAAGLGLVGFMVKRKKSI
jgi:hypothetical protein